MRIFHFCSQFLSIFQFVLPFFWCNCLFYYFSQWGQGKVAGVSVRKRNDSPLGEYRCLLLLIFW